MRLTEALSSEARFLGDFLADIARWFAEGIAWALLACALAILLYFVWPVVAVAAGAGLLWLVRRPLGKILGWLFLAVAAGVLLSVLIGALAGCSLSTLLIIILLMQITSPPQVVVVVVDSYGNKI